MNPDLKQYLIDNFGLAADASDDDAQAAYDALPDDDKAKCDAMLKAKLAEIPPEDPKAAAAMAAKRAAVITDDGDRFLAVEAKRVSQLNQLGNVLKVAPEVIATAIAAGETVIDARKSFLSHLAKTAKPIAGAAGSVRVGEDRNLSSLRTAIPQAMLAKMGYQHLYAFAPDGRVRRDENGRAVVEKFGERAHQIANLRIRDMFREYLVALGIRSDEVLRLPDDKLAKAFNRVGLLRAFPQVAMLAQGVDDFDSILANVQNKGLRMEYVEMSATWEQWCARRTTSDFKLITDTQLSDVPDLLPKDEHGKYRRVQVSDSKETWRLGEYGHIVAFTRRALLGDDLNAFAAIPKKEAAAARRLEETLAYGVLTANAAMADTVALFHATHRNLEAVTAGVGAPNVTTLGAARKALRTQTAPKGAILNLIPKFLIVPAALENVAEQYTSANYVAAVQTNINPFAGTGRTPLVPIVQPRLDAVSSTVWYAAADKNQIDTVKLCFLESEPEPVLEQNEDFHSDDVEYKVRHAAAAAALDYRGLYKNPGA